MFYFHPYLGKIPILTNIFQRGWNHQLVKLSSKSGSHIFVLALEFPNGPPGPPKRAQVVRHVPKIEVQEVVKHVPKIEVMDPWKQHMTGMMEVSPNLPTNPHAATLHINDFPRILGCISTASLFVAS